MQRKTKTAAALLLTGAHCLAARLTPAAGVSFEHYVSHLEARLARQHVQPEAYLATLNCGAAERASAERRLESGAMLIEPVHGGTWEVTGGLMHHWRGAALIPGAAPEDMLALLRDYNHLSRYYAPEVISSRALADRGETAAVAMRFREQQVFTIVLDAEFAVETQLDGADRGYSSSRSLHVWEVDNPGTAAERRRAEGRDDGFLWRLNSYWSFLRTRDGLLIECEAVSLTRDVPAGLGWLLTPVVEQFPRASLKFTLESTKNALLAGAAREARP